MVLKRKRKLILLAEDDSVLRPLLVEFLDEMQFEVLSAEDGRQALELLKELKDSQNSIDLLLTDIGLPEINGSNLARLAREIWPDLSILFITGYAHGIENMSIGGKTQLLTKPFSLDILTKRIEELIPD